MNQSEFDDFAKTLREPYQRLLDSLKDDFCPSCGGESCDRVLDDYIIKISRSVGYTVRCCQFEAARLQNMEDGTAAKTTDQLLALAEIPPTFADCTFDNFEQTEGTRAALAVARDYVERYENFRESGMGLLFLGPRGTGKTRLICTILTQLVTRYGLTARYRFAPEFLDALRPDGANGSRDRMLIDETCRVGMVALDDIGSEKASDWTNSIYERVVDARYRSNRPILVGSNFTTVELKQAIGFRAADRLLERSFILEFSGDSYRERGERKAEAWSK